MSNWQVEERGREGGGESPAGGHDWLIDWLTD